MDLAQLEAFRDAIKAQHDNLLRNQTTPGQEILKHVNVIELLAGMRTVEQLITQERASLVKPPGSLGPILVGV